MEKLERARCQDREHIAELREAVQQERAQTLNMMEKLNAGTAEKAELEEEISEMQTQLVRHKDEIEELSSLYEAEKLQSSVLEEALQAEKENFNKLTQSLSEERKRFNEASARDCETILELRTELEMEKEKEVRPASARSNKGSKTSLFGSRQSVNQHDELLQVNYFLIYISFDIICMCYQKKIKYHLKRQMTCLVLNLGWTNSLYSFAASQLFSQGSRN